MFTVGPLWDESMDPRLALSNHTKTEHFSVVLGQLVELQHQVNETHGSSSCNEVDPLESTSQHTHTNRPPPTVQQQPKPLRPATRTQLRPGAARWAASCVRKSSASLTKFTGGALVEFHSLQSSPSHTGRHHHTTPAHTARRARWEQRCCNNGDFAVPSRQQSSVVAGMDNLHGCSHEHPPPQKKKRKQKIGTAPDGRPGFHHHHLRDRHEAASARSSPAIWQVVSTADRSGYHALGQADVDLYVQDITSPATGLATEHGYHHSFCWGRGTWPNSSQATRFTRTAHGNPICPPPPPPVQHITGLLFPELLICTHLQPLPGSPQLIDLWG